MEAFGLNAHIKDVASRIAAEGYVTLAPDMYYREPNNVVGYDQLPDAIRLMTSLRDDTIVADMAAAVTYLQSQDFVRGDRIGVTGFCMGGRISFLTACKNSDIKAAAPFYGGGIGGLLDQAPKITCPMLLFFGDQDPFIPNEEVDKIRATLAKLKKTGRGRGLSGRAARLLLQRARLLPGRRREGCLGASEDVLRQAPQVLSGCSRSR